MRTVFFMGLFFLGGDGYPSPGSFSYEVQGVVPTQKDCQAEAAAVGKQITESFHATVLNQSCLEVAPTGLYHIAVQYMASERISPTALRLGWERTLVDTYGSEVSFRRGIFRDFAECRALSDSWKKEFTARTGLVAMVGRCLAAEKSGVILQIDGAGDVPREFPLVLEASQHAGPQFFRDFQKNLADRKLHVSLRRWVQDHWIFFYWSPQGLDPMPFYFSNLSIFRPKTTWPYIIEEHFLDNGQHCSWELPFAKTALIKANRVVLSAHCSSDSRGANLNITVEPQRGEKKLDYLEGGKFASYEACYHGRQEVLARFNKSQGQPAFGAVCLRERRVSDVSKYQLIIVH